MITTITMESQRHAGVLKEVAHVPPAPDPPPAPKSPVISRERAIRAVNEAIFNATAKHPDRGGLLAIVQYRIKRALEEL